MALQLKDEGDDDDNAVDHVPEGSIALVPSSVISLVSNLQISQPLPGAAQPLPGAPLETKGAPLETKGAPLETKGSQMETKGAPLESKVALPIKLPETKINLMLVHVEESLAWLKSVSKEGRIYVFHQGLVEKKAGDYGVPSDMLKQIEWMVSDPIMNPLLMHCLTMSKNRLFQFANDCTVFFPRSVDDVERATAEMLIDCDCFASLVDECMAPQMPIGGGLCVSDAYTIATRRPWPTRTGILMSRSPSLMAVRNSRILAHSEGFYERMLNLAKRYPKVDVLLPQLFGARSAACIPLF